MTPKEMMDALLAYAGASMFWSLVLTGLSIGQVEKIVARAKDSARRRKAAVRASVYLWWAVPLGFAGFGLYGMKLLQRLFGA